MEIHLLNIRLPLERVWRSSASSLGFIQQKMRHTQVDEYSDMQMSEYPLSMCALAIPPPMLFI